MSNKTTKAVKVTDSTGKEQIYKSLKEAAEQTGYTQGLISRYCNDPESGPTRSDGLKFAWLNDWNCKESAITIPEAFNENGFRILNVDLANLPDNITGRIFLSYNKQNISMIEAKFNAVISQLNKEITPLLQDLGQITAEKAFLYMEATRGVVSKDDLVMDLCSDFYRSLDGMEVNSTYMTMKLNGEQKIQNLVIGKEIPEIDLCYILVGEDGFQLNRKRIWEENINWLEGKDIDVVKDYFLLKQVYKRLKQRCYNERIFLDRLRAACNEDDSFSFLDKVELTRLKINI